MPSARILMHTDHPTIPIDFEAGFSYFDCSYFDRIIIWGHLLEIVVGTPQRRCAGRFHMLKSRLGILPVVDLSVEAKVLAPFDYGLVHVDSRLSRHSISFYTLYFKVRTESTADRVATLS